MPTVYLYVLGASSDPDHLESSVPWRVDDREVFFGPCKKPLRALLRPRFLGPQVDRVSVGEEVYFAGFNSIGTQRIRKLVWAGRIREAMSFGRAWRDLTGPRYRTMRTARASPVHLEPMEGGGRATAYRHFGLEHARNDAWLDDLLDPRAKRLAVVSGNTVSLPVGLPWWEGFPRDICFLLDNLFFAEGFGLDLDEELVGILREAQPGRDGVSALRVFGLTAGGTPDGRRGGHLELTGTLADRFLQWLRAHTTEKAKAQVEAVPEASRSGADRCVRRTC